MEARSMSPDDGLGLDEDEHVGPPCPQPAQGKDLEHEVGVAAEGGDEGAKEQQKDLEHCPMRIDDGEEIPVEHGAPILQRIAVSLAKA